MTELITNFHFLRPYLLLLAAPAVALILALIHQQKMAVQWQSFIAPHLLKYLVDGEAATLQKRPLFGLLGIWLLASIAAAGPVWKKLPQPVVQDAAAMVILWDLSPSMKAEDLTPSRMVRARLKLTDLLRSRKEGVTALIAYSGEAHMVTPLTDDTDTIISLLVGLHPDMMPVSGSNPETALEMAIKLLKDGNIARGDIVFITDGIAESAHTVLADLAHNTQHRFTVWGVGTAEGAPIPGRHSGFLKNNNGDIIISKVDENQLSQAAIAMGGTYVPFTSTDFDLKTVESQSSVKISELNIEKTRTFDKWYEHGPYILLLLLPFAALAFRRGWLISLAMLWVFITPKPAHAFSWDDLWKTQNQQAAEALSNNKPEDAAKQFKDPQWQGVAQYKSGDYQASVKSFQADNTASAHFNQGNALAHLGDYDNAISAYNKALEIDSELEAAQHNKAIVERLKAQEEQQAQQNQDPSQQNQQENQQEQNPENQQAQNQQNPQPENSSQQDQQQSEQSQQQDSSQQESQQAQNSQDGQPSQQQNDGDNNDNSDASSEQKITEQQQKALQEKYGQNQENQGDNQEQTDEQQTAMAAEKGEENAEENNDDTPMIAKQEEEPSEQEQHNGEDSSAVAMARPAKEQTEEQQALEQWLRKVPDNPSGLLKNKFRYETQLRKREMRSGRIRTPDLTEERL